MMSAKPSAGLWLEGTPAIPVYVGPEVLRLDRLGQQIYLAADQLGQAPLQGRKREKPDTGFRVQFGGKVNVAIGFGVAASDRTE
jgi:hypothetical protein